MRTAGVRYNHGIGRFVRSTLEILHYWHIVLDYHVVLFN